MSAETVPQISRTQAVELIHDLIDAEIRSMKEMNSGRGRVTKKTEQQEYKAVRTLFHFLTGSAMTDEEFEEVLP